MAFLTTEYTLILYHMKEIAYEEPRCEVIWLAAGEMICQQSLDFSGFNPEDDWDA